MEKSLEVEKVHREEAARLLVQIVESSDDAILSKTLDGVITSWNSAASRMFGHTAEEAIGANISLLIPPERLAEEADIIRQMKAGRSIDHYETVRRHKDGREILVSLSVSPIRDRAGKIVGASKIARDITEQRRSEARLQTLHAELAHVTRLSAMGQMSAAIAHELNQPLTAINNYISASQRMLDGAPPSTTRIEGAREAMEKAAAQTMRAGMIIKRLREFVEKREMVRHQEDLRRIVQESVALALVSASDNNVNMDADLPSEPLLVMVDRIQIQQVLFNLIRNSIEAMAGSSARRMKISAGGASGGRAWLLLEDSGPGFSPDVSAKLFQPFVTTKEKGMGIGLSICRAIIEGHDGTIGVAPGTLGGAAFRLELPLAAPPEEIAFLNARPE